ncbi:peptidase inhibitor family I36 protein [Amycolatopsis albispora]|uniref:peptidase inhibitor family I36 protein n=1 Tax=Amycolatopsis albispora TaxID=1804986 RepID=UPI000DE2316A
MPKFKGLCAALGLAALVAAAPAATAHAAPSSDGTVSVAAYSDCPAGFFCMWDGRDGTGNMLGYDIGSGGESNLHNVAHPRGDWGDKTRSVWNRTGTVWCTYIDIKFERGLWKVGNWRGNTWQYGRELNISSLHPHTPATPCRPV